LTVCLIWFAVGDKREKAHFVCFVLGQDLLSSELLQYHLIPVCGYESLQEQRDSMLSNDVVRFDSPVCAIWTTCSPCRSCSCVQ
jgi:hypothetical protein